LSGDVLSVGGVAKLKKTEPVDIVGVTAIDLFERQ
jgi:hypothetical protein